MDKLIGVEILRPEGGKIPLEEVISPPLILLLLSASWCPPCQMFNPIIKKFYYELNKESKKVEIIFISCDRNVQEFYEQFHSLMFPALPFSSSKIDDLEEAVEANEIPMCSVVNKKEGVIKCKDVCGIIQEKGVSCYDKLMEISFS